MAQADIAASKEKLREYFCTLLDCVEPAVPSLFKFGSAIRDHLDLDIDDEATATLLGLRVQNEQISRALSAALFGTISTSLGTANLDVAVHAIATFVHSLTAFDDLIENDPWRPLFGRNTIYRYATISGLEDQDSEGH